MKYANGNKMKVKPDEAGIYMWKNCVKKKTITVRSKKQMRKLYNNTHHHSSLCWRGQRHVKKLNTKNAVELVKLMRGICCKHANQKGTKWSWESLQACCYFLLKTIFSSFSSSSSLFELQMYHDHYYNYHFQESFQCLQHLTPHQYWEQTKLFTLFYWLYDLWRMVSSFVMKIFWVFGFKIW